MFSVSNPNSILYVFLLGGNDGLIDANGSFDAGNEQVVNVILANVEDEAVITGDVSSKAVTWRVPGISTASRTTRHSPRRLFRR